MKICRTMGTISIAFLVFCGLQACQKTNKNGVPVTVTSMIPNHGGTGTLVTITGTGFFPDESLESVSVGGVNANIVNASSTTLEISIPMVADSATVDSALVLVVVQDQAAALAGVFYFDITVSTDVSTFAGSGSGGSGNGTGTAASFSDPENGVFDKLGNLYVADYGNNEIRMVTPAGVVSTIAGSKTAGWKDGPASQALFDAPSGLVFDDNGNLYVSDEMNNRIRMIDPSGNVSTVAGSGTAGYHDAPGTGAQFNRPIGLAYDSVGGILYVADSRNNVIRMIQLNQSDAVFTFAGSGQAGSTDGQFINGTPLNVTFNSPRGLALYHASTLETILYVADYSNNKVRECVILGDNVAVSTANGDPNNQAGFSNGSAATFNGPNSLAIGFSKSQNNYALLIADASNHVIRISANTELNTLFTGDMPIETLAGTGTAGLKNGTYSAAQFYFPDGVAYNPVDGNVYVIEFGNSDVRKVILP